MRLANENILIIKNCVQYIFGENARVYLFGSRVDDSKKGGDIDLYLEIDDKQSVFEKKIELLSALRKSLGDQKIDLIINDFSKEKDIYKIAKSTGILL